jgi:ribosomal-protein-alanine N-acetyltransferase
LAGKKIAGILVAPSQDGPVAWVRLLALGDGYNPQALLDALLLAAGNALRAQSVETLACLAYPDWLARLLHDLGFTPYTDVTTFRKSDRRIPNNGLRDLIVRAAGQRDLPTVLKNDRAAFEPLWWHSADSLQRVLGKVAHFVVGELDGKVVGHAFSDLYGDQGHLVRLAVHPRHQGLGIGSRLLAESLSHMLDIGAWPLTLNTQSDNFTSQSLYSRFGYLPVNEMVTVMTRQL